MRAWKGALLFATAALVPLAGGLAIQNCVVSEIESAKAVHHATGTIVGREYLRLDAGTSFYVNDDGAAIRLNPGEEQWRVYYQVESIDGAAQRRGERVLQRERERVASGTTRFRLESKDCYDQAKVGGKVEISYRHLREDLLEIVSVDIPGCT